MLMELNYQINGHNGKKTWLAGRPFFRYKYWTKLVFLFQLGTCIEGKFCLDQTKPSLKVIPTKSSKFHLSNCFISNRPGQESFRGNPILTFNSLIRKIRVHKFWIMESNKVSEQSLQLSISTSFFQCKNHMIIFDLEKYPFSPTRQLGHVGCQNLDLGISTNLHISSPIFKVLCELFHTKKAWTKSRKNPNQPLTC